MRSNTSVGKQQKSVSVPQIEITMVTMRSLKSTTKKDNIKTPHGPYPCVFWSNKHAAIRCVTFKKYFGSNFTREFCVRSNPSWSSGCLGFFGMLPASNKQKLRINSMMNIFHGNMYIYIVYLNIHCPIYLQHEQRVDIVWELGRSLSFICSSLANHLAYSHTLLPLE